MSRLPSPSGRGCWLIAFGTAVVAGTARAQATQPPDVSDVSDVSGVSGVSVGAAVAHPVAGAPDRTRPPVARAPEPPVPPTIAVTRLSGRARAAPIPVASVGAGAEVWMVERHDLPLVRVELTLSEPAGVEGSAWDGLAAVWEEGTAAHPGRGWQDAVAMLGARVSLGCGPLRCWCDLDAPAETVDAALDLAAEAVASPALAASGVAAWRRTARADWRTDWAAPGIVQERALGRLLWADGHPNRRDRTAEAFRIGPQDVRAAWAALVSEGRPGVVVVGDFTPATLLPRIEEAYGWLAGAAGPVATAPPRLETPHFALIDAPGAAQARVAVTWAGPAAGAPDASAYALAFRALAQGFASRLNLRLREAEALTYGVDGAYTDGAGYGLSQVQLRVDGGRVVDALAALRTELDRLGRGDLDVAALQAARAGAWVERAGDGATRVGLASQLGTEMLFGLAPGETARRLAMYRDVSLAEANAAAIRWLGTPRLWVVTGDRDTLEPALDAAGWPVDTLMSACTAVYGGPCPAR